MRFSFLFPVLCVFLLLGCSEVEFASHVAKKIPSGSQTEGTFKVGSPYKVQGKWYHPKETYSFSETGIASWYGPQFHGKRTANGEIFDMNELTAAHRTLQMPSLVRVTNLENGRSLVVRVNDRGPFKRGRVIDLSKRAAELLDFKSKGTAKVKLQVLANESRAVAASAKRGEDTSGVEVAMNQNGLERPARPKAVQAEEREVISRVSVANVPEVEREVLPGSVALPGHLKEGRFLPDPIIQEHPVTPTNIFVQVGAFSQRENAQGLAQSMNKYGRALVYPAQVNNQQFYRVRFPAQNVEDADALLSRLANDGHSEAIIIVD